MSSENTHVKEIGSNGIGYVYLPNAGVPLVGLCVMHHPNNNPRLAFDFTVKYLRGFNESRRLCVEFALLEPRLLPNGVFVLLSRRFWTDLKGRSSPLGSDEWRPFPAGYHTSEIWKGEILYRMPWGVELTWPIQSKALPKLMGLSDREIALWDSDESLCVINAKLLSQKGELVIRNDCSWFVPRALW